ncbi:hypothetical protein [Thiothrix unzii]|jgi:hypothetical protein|uniref:hypothetical protein n=1 Tax=Thiothrix unzii TaxID=111769 RepID=UPI002A362505|nr:hypothetical protein [Thiothrix unzii]MDX9990007.1 hypothetical protein [Thiothrix unzii]
MTKPLLPDIGGASSISMKHASRYDFKAFMQNNPPDIQPMTLMEDGTFPLVDDTSLAHLPCLVSIKLLDQWFPDGESLFINTGPGSGKSTFVEWNIRLLGGHAVQLVVFRNEMESMARNLWLNHGIEPNQYVSVEHFQHTDKTVIATATTVQSYTNVLFKSYASKLYPDVKFTEATTQQELESKVLAAVKDKIVFIDESDFIIQQVISETMATIEGNTVTSTKSQNVKNKLEALLIFYRDIQIVAKRILFMSATSNVNFNYILEHLGVQTITPDFLEQQYQQRHNRIIKLISFNLKKISYVRYVQKRLDSNTYVSNHIIADYLSDKTYKKALIYSTRVEIEATANIIVQAIRSNRTVKVITSVEKINAGWETYVNEDGRRSRKVSKLNRLGRFQQSVLKIVSNKLRHDEYNKDIFQIIKDEGGNQQQEIESHLNDNVIQKYDIVLITTSNARAVSLTSLEGEDVLIITDENSTNTEVVQSWARFRKAHVHAVVLRRHNRELLSGRDVTSMTFVQHIDENGDLFRTPVTEFEHLTAHLGSHVNRDITDYNDMNQLCVEIMNHYKENGLSNGAIACVEDIKHWSNLSVEEEIVSKYAEYEIMSKDVNNYIKVNRKGKATGKGTVNQSKRILLSNLLRNEPKLKYNEIIDRCESEFDWKPSNNIISRVKDELIKGQASTTTA